MGEGMQPLLSADALYLPGGSPDVGDDLEQRVSCLGGLFPRAKALNDRRVHLDPTGAWHRDSASPQSVVGVKVTVPGGQVFFVFDDRVESL
jgi:hypothetical protein